MEVLQFASAWLVLPPDQRSTLAQGLLPGQFDRLGVDAVIGVRAWDPQAGIVLRIGPLNRAGFTALLPDRPALRQLVSLVRALSETSGRSGCRMTSMRGRPSSRPCLDWSGRHSLSRRVRASTTRAGVGRAAK